MSYSRWKATGQRAPLGPSGEAVFFRISGEGSDWVTLLHGFPTCSWDFAPVIGALETRYRVLAFDFQGFGSSDKPPEHPYSISGQADIAVALWRKLGIERTALLAHDYGVTVAQELLARAAESPPGMARIERATFLNGGLYPELHRPIFAQKLLHSRVLGPWLSGLATKKLFIASMRRIGSPEWPIPLETLDQLWGSMCQQEGQKLSHRLLHYMDERRTHRARWVGALEAAPMPLAFIWGMLDPVSGRHVVARLKERLPRARIHELEDCGHYPHLERPELVRSALLRASDS